MHFFCTERGFWVDIPRVQKIILENNVFRIINQFLFFGLSALTFWMFGELFNGWFVKTAFYGFRGHFWRKKNSKKNCTTSSCTKRGFWVELLFGICSSPSRISGDKYCGCIAGSLSVGLSKLNLACPYYPVGDILFEVFINFFIFGLSA